MLMIVLHHIFVHCATTQLTDPSSIAQLNNGWFCYPVIYERLFIFTAATSWGPIGNSIFILISGYFLACKEPDRIDLAKTAKKLLEQVVFSVLFLIAVSALARQLSGVNYSLETLTSPNTGGWAWFVGYYFVIILIGRLWLNGHLASLDRKRYATELVCLLAITQFSWTMSLLAGFSDGLSALAIGLFLYALGGFIGKFDCFGRIKAGAIILLMVALSLLMFASYANYVQTAIEMRDPTQAFIQPVETHGNASLIAIVISICLFELFTRINMPGNAVINFLGASTLMVYLVHDDEFFYSIWGQTDWITLLHLNYFGFFANLLLVGLMTFGIGVLAYVAYRGAVAGFGRVKHVFLKPEASA